MLKTDKDIMLEEHQFIRSDTEDERNQHRYETRLIRRQYDSLYKEFALCDMSNINDNEDKSGYGMRLGLRWRTENEIIKGLGETSCGNIHCSIVKASKRDESNRLHSYEIPFGYREHGHDKLELVKVRLCKHCAEKIVNDK
jgi:protein FRA10AC1